MMLFKLSYKNIRKSMKDYAIFFCTLVIGIAIFYVFNAIEKQTIMLDVKAAKYSVIDLITSILNGVSVFVSIVLGLLVVYASNFLIKRRKKEFGTYMLLGMSKKDIATIMFGETIIIGAISLVIGLVIGVIASQGMSIFVADLFEVDMSKFKFVVSVEAITKTILYFVIMYLIVIIFDIVVVGKAKLINLLNASKKAEIRVNKNIYLCTIIFVISIIILGSAYYKVAYDFMHLNQKRMFSEIILGIIGTFIFFWSLSGIIIFIATRCKSFYLKGINCFSTKEISTRVNSNICSVSIICLMMFFTICMLSTGFTIRNSINEQIIRDVNKDIVFRAIQYDKEKDYPPISEEKILEKLDLKDIVKIDARADTYIVEGIKFNTFIQNLSDKDKEDIEKYTYSLGEEIMRVSDYNKLAKAYGMQEYSLADNEYMVICNYDEILPYRNKYLKNKQTFKLKDKTYTPKYEECKDGYIIMSSQNLNIGVVLVPDDVEFDKKELNETIVVGSYNRDYKYPNKYDSLEEYVDDKLINEKDLEEKESGASIIFTTKSLDKQQSIGLKAMVVFISIYIGIIFMISSAAILSLKSLSDATDNAYKYLLIRRIGVSEKMLHKSVFNQSLIFFGMPVSLAVIHSIFGIKFTKEIVHSMGFECSSNSIRAGVVVMLVIYLLYFLITYFASRKIIDEKK